MAKFLGKMVIVLGTVLLSGWLLTSTTMAAEGQIAVVDVQRALAECNSGKKALAELRLRGDKLTAEINVLNEEIQALRRELENNAVMLKPEVKLAKERDFERKMRQLNDRRRDAQQEMNEAQRDAMQPLLAELNKVIQELGSKGNYALIVDASTVIFIPKSSDITPQVIAAFNKLRP